MRIFSEFFGEEIEIPHEPKRIVSLAPDITEIIFRLKAENRLKGISLYCKRPFGKLDRYERVGSYLKVLWHKLEKINPDLILLSTGAQRKIAEQIRKRGLTVFAFSVPVSIWGILDNIKKAGIILNREKEACSLIDNLFKKLEKIREDKIFYRVYYEVYLGDKITCGISSYITDGLKIIGLYNIYSFKKESYFEPDDDLTRSMDFDFLLYEPHSEKIKKEILEDKLRKRFGNRKIIILPSNFLVHYGPSFIDEILPRLKKLINKRI